MPLAVSANEPMQKYEPEIPVRVIGTDSVPSPSLSPTDKFDVASALLSKTVENKTEMFVNDITSTEARFSWRSEQVIMHQLYDLCIYDKVQNTWVKMYSVTGTNAVVDRLIAGNDYTWGVRLSDSDEIMAQITFTTPAEKPTLKASLNDDDVILSFKSIGKFDNYEIYRSDGGDYEKIATIEAGENNYTDEDVKEGKTYSYKVKTVQKDGRKLENTSDEQKITIPVTTELSLPDIKSSCKTYAYYTAVTVKSSPQYKLLNSSDCYTDPETGIRMVDDCYCIALGSFYGSTIGTKYKITLSSGNSFKAILCDQKADIHTNSTHQYAVRNKDVVEFYVQKGMVPSNVNGNYNSLPQFNGYVTKIERLG